MSCENKPRSMRPSEIMRQECKRGREIILYIFKKNCHILIKNLDMRNTSTRYHVSTDENNKVYFT